MVDDTPPLTPEDINEILDDIWDQGGNADLIWIHPDEAAKFLFEERLMFGMLDDHGREELQGPVSQVRLLRRLQRWWQRRRFKKIGNPKWRYDHYRRRDR